MKNYITSLPSVHLLMILDFNLIGFRAGLGYYDMVNDVFRPAFFEVVVWKRWKTSFEFGRTQSVWKRDDR